MPHDSEYFRRRAAEARAAAFCKQDGDGAAVAGDLALAYAALAKRRALAGDDLEITAEPPLVFSE
jgi:hypothetical protein